ncbi:MAG TPA: Glu-tRNA(Gln) amidotransferase subunit GatD [archaeon]|nr:Glu-tRNA(Gln) amidotransferase subunit GatD [archaeon]
MSSNYFPVIQAALKKIKADAGERVSLVRKDGTAYEGLLMPRIELGDRSCVVLKLDSGYNIGLKFEAGSKLEKAKSAEPRKIISEEKFELGKISSEYLNLKFDQKKPPISLIATGGTIASRVDYKTGGVRMLMEPAEFLHNVPELAEFANIKKILTPFTKASEDMDYKNWQKIAELAAQELNSETRGVIITHGTDTLHYTSAALSFMLPNLSKPVVLTASQRSSDRPSSDAWMNLICAARAALGEISEVGICMHASTNDDYCAFIRGVRARKLHTSRRDAFQAIGGGYLAAVWPHGKVFEIKETKFRKRSAEKIVADTKFEPRVAFVKAYPNSDPKILEYFWNAGYKGFVIEGTGFGHVPTFSSKSWISSIKKITKDGLPVAVASQTLAGRTNDNVYANLRVLTREAGAFHVEDMLPEVAFVKLGWVLGHETDLQKIRGLMLKNFAGEISARSEVDGYG